MFIAIEGVGKGIDGAYEFDYAYFTIRELHEIKRLSGCRTSEIGEALEAGDVDVTVALAVVALKREGREVDVNRLWDAHVGAIRLVFPEEEEDPEASAPVSGATSTDPSVSSGDGSPIASESQANGQSHIGAPDSDMSATSDPVTSET